LADAAYRRRSGKRVPGIGRSRSAGGKNPAERAVAPKTNRCGSPLCAVRGSDLRFLIAVAGLEPKDVPDATHWNLDPTIVERSV